MLVAADDLPSGLVAVALLLAFNDEDVVCRAALGRGVLLVRLADAVVAVAGLAREVLALGDTTTRIATTARSAIATFRVRGRAPVASSTMHTLPAHRFTTSCRTGLCDGGYRARLRFVSNETRILVLGQSNSGGAQLGDPTAAWPNIIAGALADLVGSPIALTFRTFYAHAPGASTYLGRELIRGRPDIAVLMLTPFAFLVPMVGPGVRRRYGDRAGDAYQWLERRFDRATRGGSPLGSSANRMARRLTHAVLGAAPTTSYDVVLEGTAEALRRLAHDEQVQVVAVQGFIRLPSGTASKARERSSLVRRYLDDTRTLAERLNVTYLDLPQGTLQETDAFFLPDSTHITAAAHRAVAEVILKAFKDGRISARSD